MEISREQKMTDNILLFSFNKGKPAFDFCGWDAEYLHFMIK